MGSSVLCAAPQLFCPPAPVVLLVDRTFASLKLCSGIYFVLSVFVCNVATLLCQPKEEQTKKRVPAWKNVATLLLILICLPVPGAGGCRNNRIPNNKRKSSESSIGALLSQTN